MVRHLGTIGLADFEKIGLGPLRRLCHPVPLTLLVFESQAWVGSDGLC